MTTDEELLLEFPGADLVPADEVQAIFDRKVWPLYAERIKQSQRGAATPQATLLVGQMGAGKTTIGAARLAAQLGPDVHHDHVDIYRHFHPRAAEHMAADPSTYTARTRQAAKHLRGLLLPRLQAAGVPILMERVESKPEKLIAVLEDFKRAGYGLTLSVMAVPLQLSWQGCVARYVDGEAKQPGHGRWAQPDRHDKRVAQVITTAQVAAGSGLLDHWTVETRQGRVAEASADRSGWPDEIMAAINREWSRTWSPTEQAAYKAEWQRIGALAATLTLPQDLRKTVTDSVAAGLRPDATGHAKVFESPLAL